MRMTYDDADRARSFYAEAFGWTASAVPGMDYTIVLCGPTGDDGQSSEPGFINGGMTRREESRRGPTVIIDVADIGETLAKVQELGGSVVLPSTPVGDLGHSAYFTDSEGNVIGLWQEP